MILHAQPSSRTFNAHLPRPRIRTLVLVLLLLQPVDPSRNLRSHLTQSPKCLLTNPLDVFHRHGLSGIPSIRITVDHPPGKLAHRARRPLSLIAGLVDLRAVLLIQLVDVLFRLSGSGIIRLHDCRGRYTSVSAHDRKGGKCPDVLGASTGSTVRLGGARGACIIPPVGTGGTNRASRLAAGIIGAVGVADAAEPRGGRTGGDATAGFCAGTLTLSRGGMGGGCGAAVSCVSGRREGRGGGCEGVFAAPAPAERFGRELSTCPATSPANDGDKSSIAGSSFCRGIEWRLSFGLKSREGRHPFGLTRHMSGHTCTRSTTIIFSRA